MTNIYSRKYTPNFDEIWALCILEESRTPNPTMNNLKILLLGQRRSFENLEDLNLVKNTTTTTTINHMKAETCPEYNALGAMDMDTLKGIVPWILRIIRKAKGNKEGGLML